METGPQFKVSSERLEKQGNEITTTGVQGECFNHYGVIKKKKKKNNNNNNNNNRLVTYS